MNVFHSCASTIILIRRKMKYSIELLVKLIIPSLTS